MTGARKPSRKQKHNWPVNDEVQAILAVWLVARKEWSLLRTKASMGPARVALSLGGKRRSQGRRGGGSAVLSESESWSSWAVQFRVRPHTTLPGDPRWHPTPLDS